MAARCLMNVSPMSGLVMMSARLSAVGTLVPVVRKMPLDFSAKRIMAMHGATHFDSKDAFAAGAVDEDAGVGEDNRWALLLETELFEERAYACNGFDAANRLKELSGAGGRRQWRGDCKKPRSCR